MKFQIRHMKFWGEYFLEDLGVTAACAVFMFVIMALGNEDWNKTGAIAVFPYYLLISGMLLTLVTGVGFFQIYFPTLLSMNVTRKSIIRGTWLLTAAKVALLVLLAAGTWKLFPGDAANTGKTLLPLLAGIFLVIAGVGMILGAGRICWKTLGTIIAAVSFGAAGMGIGFFVALAPEDGSQMMRILASLKLSTMLPAAIGAVFYIGAGIFVRMMTRKTEVRA